MADLFLKVMLFLLASLLVGFMSSLEFSQLLSEIFDLRLEITNLSFKSLNTGVGSLQGVSIFVFLVLLLLQDLSLKFLEIGFLPMQVVSSLSDDG